MSSITIKSKIVHWANKSTFHAIPNIFSNDKIIVKILWIFCFLISFGYCAWLVIGNLVTFFKYEVITILEVASDSESQFPTITICNLNPCNYEKFDDYQYNITLRQILLNNEGAGSLADNLDPNNFEQNGNFSIEAKSISDYLKMCTFEGKRCDASHFKQIKQSDFKVCYKFNADKSNIKKTKKFGKSNGLSLELVVDDFDECKNDSYKSVSVYVHNYTNWISDDSSGVLVRPGLETDIAIEKTLLTKQAKPFSNCVKDSVNQKSYSEMVRKTFQLIDPYTQQYCTHLCFQEFLIEKLSCYDQYLPFFKNTTTSVCDDKDQVMAVKENFYENSIDKQCLDKCPIECELYTYKETLSIIKYPSMSYEKALGYVNPEIKPSFTSRLISLNIFFKSDIYTRIREDPNLEFADFVSNVGGTLGLFLGISILSLVEFIELTVEIIEIYLESRMKNKVRADVVQVEPVE